VRVLMRCGKCPSWQSHSAAIRSSIGSRCFIPNGGRYGRGHSGPPKLPNLFVLCDRYRAANLSYCMSVVGPPAAGWSSRYRSFIAKTSASRVWDGS
jgi:hypothetical protein